jgi:hypothetical protein
VQLTQRLVLIVAIHAAGGCGGSTTAATADAGNDGPGSAPPLTPDPGHVACGADTCTPPVTSCCVEADGGATCVGQQVCTGRTIACDETGDCTPGNVCCYSVGQAGFPYVQSACAPHDCIRNSIAYQACKSTADCAGTGQLCVAQACGGVVFGTCGGVDPAFCR